MYKYILLKRIFARKKNKIKYLLENLHLINIHLVVESKVTRAKNNINGKKFEKEGRKR